jgi:hypothetical protein
MSREEIAEIGQIIDAVDSFAAAMKSKLIAKYLQDGECGWAEKENFGGMYVDMCLHAERGPHQALDVANFAMFLWNMITSLNMDDHEIQELLDEGGVQVPNRLDPRAGQDPGGEAGA